MDIGSAFLVLSLWWQREIPARILLSHSDSKGFVGKRMSTWTERRAETIDKMVFGLTLPWNLICEEPSARAEAHSARACSCAGQGEMPKYAQ